MFCNPARAYLIFAFLALGACAPRGAIEMATIGPDVPASTQAVFVATDRKPSGPDDFGAARDKTLHFARYDISIPSDRQPGRIEWPRHHAPDPSRDFVTRDLTHYPDRAGMRRALSAALASRPASNREVVIFVHGYNNTFAEGLYRAAQMGHDFATKSVLLTYSWPSAANPLTYAYDRDSVLFARQGLVDLIHLARRAGARQVAIVAHSMGAQLTMEALVRMDLADPGSAAQDVQTVALISPDIDTEVFLSQTRTLKRLPRDFVIFTSRKDRILRVSALVTGQKQRLGNISKIDALSGLKLTVLDVTGFNQTPDGHFTAAKSPALISLLAQMSALNEGFQTAGAHSVGLIPAVILRVRQATRVVLVPGSVEPEAAP